MKTTDAVARRLRENLGRLKHLLVVGRYGSVSRAAASLNVSQSTLSHSLKSLQVAVGAPLFVRKSRGVELTAAGNIVAALGTNLEQSLENAAAQLTHGDQATRSYRIGTHETMAVHVWPTVLHQLRGESDRFRLSLISGRIDELVNSLLQGGIDILVTVRPSTHHKLDIRPLYTGTFGFFESPSAPKSIYSVSRLRQQPILTDVRAHCRQGLSIPEALYENGLLEDGPFEVSSFEAAIQLAANGFGIAVIPDRIAARAVADGKLRAITVRGLRRPSLLRYSVCMSTRSDSERWPLLDLLVRYIR